MQMQNLKLYLYFYLEHVLTSKISLKLAKNKGVMPIKIWYHLKNMAMFCENFPIFLKCLNIPVQ